MLVVQFGISEDTIRFNVEPVMHVLAISFGYMTATTGLFLDLYNNADLWCWIAPYPSGCQDARHNNGEDDGSCTRGADAWIYRYVVGRRGAIIIRSDPKAALVSPFGLCVVGYCYILFYVGGPFIMHPYGL
jgi:hypothetical protein